METKAYAPLAVRRVRELYGKFPAVSLLPFLTEQERKAPGRDPSYYIRSMNAEKSLTTEVVRLVFALPIFPGSRPPSIVGVHVLNFCVRDGNRWTHMTINTNYIYPSLSAEITFGDPYRIRTDVNGVRGRCLNHLTNGPLVHLQGLEPGTH